MAGKTFKEYFLRAVALLGLLAVLLLGAWGIIQIAFFISSVFSNAGGHVSTTPTPAHETMTISLPNSILAGQGVVVRWGHQGGEGAYTYALSYSCADGLTFKAPTPAGSLQEVPCNTPFNFTNATNTVTITPSTKAQATTTITVRATQLSTGKITATATGGLVVLGSAPTTSTKPSSGSSGTTIKPSTSKPTQSTVSSGRTTNLYGSPDLAVYITSVTSVGGNATAQFVIENVGTNVVPAGWSFQAILPINGSYTYPSGPQQAIYPGGKIAFTLAYGDYDNASYYGGSSFSTCNYSGPCTIPSYPYGYPNYPYTATNYGYTGSYLSGYPNNTYPYQKSVTITADPFNQIYDLNRSNNSATLPYMPR